MDIVAKLDDWGKPAWIAVTILAFIIFWPIGLAILAYIIWSGRMGCWKHGGWRRRHHDAAGRNGAEGRWYGRRGGSSSGNLAFDEYREETMRRLEDEQKEFWSFLDRLRHAKDKAEFDQFMADRRRRPTEGPDAPDITDSPNGPAPQPQT